MSTYQSRKRSLLREKMLNFFILFISICAILGGIGMILHSIFNLHVTDIKPYFLFLIMIGLGIVGIRNYKKEVEF